VNFPVLQERHVANEVRGYWALRKEIVFVFEAGQRVRGYVVYVSPSNSFALVWDGSAEAHIPMALVLSHHRPHFSEPLDGSAVSLPPARAVHVPMVGQMELWTSADRPLQW
jgi:hypothetical protein